MAINDKPWIYVLIDIHIDTFKNTNDNGMMQLIMQDHTDT